MGVSVFSVIGNSSLGWGMFSCCCCLIFYTWMTLAVWVKFNFRHFKCVYICVFGSKSQWNILKSYKRIFISTACLESYLPVNVSNKSCLVILELGSKGSTSIMGYMCTVQLVGSKSRGQTRHVKVFVKVYFPRDPKLLQSKCLIPVSGIRLFLIRYKLASLRHSTGYISPHPMACDLWSRMTSYDTNIVNYSKGKL